MAAIIGAIGLKMLIGTTGQLSLGARVLRRRRRLRLLLLRRARGGSASTARRPRAAAAAGDGARRRRSPGWPARSSARSPAACAASTSASPRSAWSSSASTSCYNATRSTGGFNGRDVPPFSLFGFQLRQRRPRRSWSSACPFGELERLWYLGLVLVASSLLVRAQPRRAAAPAARWRRVRDSEVAAAVMGVDVARYKAAAFTVSSMYAGLGGRAVSRSSSGASCPTSFGFPLSVDFLAMIVLGGLGSVGGAVARRGLRHRAAAGPRPLQRLAAARRRPRRAAVCSRAQAARLLYGLRDRRRPAVLARRPGRPRRAAAAPRTSRSSQRRHPRVPPDVHRVTETT